MLSFACYIIKPKIKKNTDVENRSQMYGFVKCSDPDHNDVTGCSIIIDVCCMYTNVYAHSFATGSFIRSVVLSSEMKNTSAQITRKSLANRNIHNRKPRALDLFIQRYTKPLFSGNFFTREFLPLTSNCESRRS